MFMINLLSYIVLIPSAVLCLFPMKNLLRYSVRKTAIIMGFTVIPLMLVISLAQTLSSKNDNFFLIPILIVCFIAYHACLKASVWKSAAVFFASVALMSIIFNIALAIHAIAHNAFAVAAEPYFTDMIQLCLSVIITLLLAKPYMMHGSEIIRHTDHPRVWQISLLLSLVIYGISMLLLPVEESVLSESGYMVYLLLLLVLLLFLWLLIQLLFYYIVSGLNTMAKTNERNRFLEMQEKQFSAQQQYMKATERTRHDFRHSVRVMTELYDAGDMDAVGEYLHNYAKSMPVSEATDFCKNTAVNALLNYYAHVARQEEIDLTFQIDLPEDLPVSDMDICNILGNILENAVLACQKIENRYIRLTVLTENNAQLYIVAVNSFDGNVRQKDGRYLSTNRTGDGLGLSSIASTVESCGGVSQFSHDGNCFFSNIAIPLR